ncbi:protein-tyrosine phosphatase-like protein [Protomyces lactucae-debilis]|uniref:protein-tyrosine-phosphatase n=1 Tax=Protomyces lactucae-debilis TaxID=2754530 RepID=A0A1Y2FGK0_PROLT|nr:protein-tyrosine phosphatase-like protein [Protomyces lactucae-debilis]ORY83049.1 protein-tyrosine phosphatase-like protein [Protomyces lactucae-debilis]
MYGSDNILPMDEAGYAVDEGKKLSLDQLRAQAVKYKTLAKTEFAQARDKQLLVSHVRQQKFYEQAIQAREDKPLREADELQGNVATDAPSTDTLLTEVQPGLYISSYEVLQHDELLKHQGISHILSVCRHFHPSSKQQADYTCLQIDALDTTEQDLIQLFDKCNAFITEALRNGKVLVHCHAGQSRSVAVVAAYLMSASNVPLASAIDLISSKRQIDLSDTFRRQLQVYAQCGNRVDPTHEAYQTWRLQHRNGVLRLQDDTIAASPGLHTAIRCKKCRFVLASEKHIQRHSPKELTAGPCAHLFIDPVRWMKAELDLGLLEGRFTCPGRNCHAKIGSYAWQGMNCSCRAWILPGLALHRSRVDEFKTAKEVVVVPARKDAAPS